MPPDAQEIKSLRVDSVAMLPGKGIAHVRKLWEQPGDVALYIR